MFLSGEAFVGGAGGVFLVFAFAVTVRVSFVVGVGVLAGRGVLFVVDVLVRVVLGVVASVCLVPFVFFAFFASLNYLVFYFIFF